MKNILTTIFACLLLLGSQGFSQDVEARLQEARSAYGSGNLEATRFALQQAINEVDVAIGKEVLAVLPAKMGNMGYSENDDQVASAAMGFAGLYVKRLYQDPDVSRMELQILADSPLLAGVNAILALPAFVSDANQKRIRVGNYRALLQKSEDSNGVISWDVQVPFGSSLMTINVNGIDNENTVVSMVNTIPIDQVSRLIQ